jgi:hypothetical protein
MQRFEEPRRRNQIKQWRDFKGDDMLSLSFGNASPGKSRNQLICETHGPASPGLPVPVVPLPSLSSSEAFMSAGFPPERAPVSSLNIFDGSRCVRRILSSTSRRGGVFRVGHRYHI